MQGAVLENFGQAQGGMGGLGLLRSKRCCDSGLRAHIVLCRIVEGVIKTVYQ